MSLNRPPYFLGMHEEGAPIEFRVYIRPHDGDILVYPRHRYETVSVQLYDGTEGTREALNPTPPGYVDIEQVGQYDLWWVVIVNLIQKIKAQPPLTEANMPPDAARFVHAKTGTPLWAEKFDIRGDGLTNLAARNIYPLGQYTGRQLAAVAIMLIANIPRAVAPPPPRSGLVEAADHLAAGLRAAVLSSGGEVNPDKPATPLESRGRGEIARRLAELPPGLLLTGHYLLDLAEQIQRDGRGGQHWIEEPAISPEGAPGDGESVDTNAVDTDALERFARLLEDMPDLFSQDGEG